MMAPRHGAGCFIRQHKTVLQRLLEKQVENYFGRMLLRTICYSFGVGVFVAGASATDYAVSWALGLTGCLFLVAHAKRISLRVCPEVHVDSATLAQIEREEGWYDKALLALFYAKHGEPSPATYDSASISALSQVGSNFDAAAQGVVSGAMVLYPLNDVIQLVEASCKLSGELPPSTWRSQTLSFKAVSYVGVCVFVAGFGVSLGVLTTMLHITEKL